MSLDKMALYYTQFINTEYQSRDCPKCQWKLSRNEAWYGNGDSKRSERQGILLVAISFQWKMILSFKLDKEVKPESWAKVLREELKINYMKFSKQNK